MSISLHDPIINQKVSEMAENLIGSEIREKLGVIRTQELLQARRTDGGHQYFTRANDFGFSKNSIMEFTYYQTFCNFLFDNFNAKATSKMVSRRFE